MYLHTRDVRRDESTGDAISTSITFIPDVMGGESHIWVHSGAYFKEATDFHLRRRCAGRGIVALLLNATTLSSYREFSVHYEEHEVRKKGVIVCPRCFINN